MFINNNLMKNKVLVASFLALVGLTILLVVNPKTVVNQRKDNSESVTSSRLKARSTENLETSATAFATLETSIIEAAPATSTREVKLGDTIVVNYRGWLATTGVIFDQSFNRGDMGFEFTVGTGVIQGWSEGVIGMKLGEIRRLKIPAVKAYGSSSPASSIPANSDLIFDVELISIK